jgi:hypothetical protein
MARMNRTPAFLLNFAHALDHVFLLIFATAVAAIAADFGVARWEDLMPYTMANGFGFDGFGCVFCHLPPSGHTLVGAKLAHARAHHWHQWFGR